MKWVGLFLTVFCGLFLWSSPTEGQIILGRVLVAGDTLGIDGVDFTLVNAEGRELLRVQSDEAGLFRIPVVGPGRYQIVAERLGLAPVRSGFLEVEREIVDVEFRMSETANPLDPITVVERRKIRPGMVIEFYERMEENLARGVGSFITREEIERQAALNPSSLFRGIQGIEVIPTGEFENRLFMRVRGQRCVPNLYLDGLPFLLPETTQLDQILKTPDLEGIEIYTPGRVEQAVGYDTEPCGAVLLWRKADRGHPLSVKTLLAVVGLGIALFWVGGGG